VLTPEDAPDELTRLAVATPSSVPLNDIEHLDTNMWHEEGLRRRLMDAVTAQMLKADPDADATSLAFRQGVTVEGNRRAQWLALNALTRDPMGVLSIVSYNYGRLRSQSGIRAGLKLDMSQLDDGISEGFANSLARNFRLARAERIAKEETLTKRYFLSPRGWYKLLAYAPLIGILSIFLGGKSRRGGAVFLTVVSVGLIAAVCLFAQPVSVRLMLPVAWLTLVLFCLCAAGIWQKISPWVKSRWVNDKAGKEMPVG
jgi:hypothetical protein